MKLGKWIGGIMGFMAMGPLGALAGYAIGSLFDKAAYVPESTGTDDGNATYEGQRNSFLFSLLVMASYIIRADGKIMIMNFGYAVKNKEGYQGVVVTSVLVTEGKPVSTSVAFVPGNLTVKSKKGHGVICSPKNKKDKNEESETED